MDNQSRYKAQLPSELNIFPCLETHNEQYTYSLLDPNRIGENKIKILNDQLAYAKHQFVKHKS